MLVEKGGFFLRKSRDFGEMPDYGERNGIKRKKGARTRWGK